MNSGRIYFVGGASASGKSVATKQMASEHKLPLIELDKIFNALKGVGDDELQKKLIKSLALQLVKDLLSTGSSAIVEGGWIEPDSAADLVKSSEGRLCAVFCGYPDADVEQRFKLMQSEPCRDRQHWLLHKDQPEALDWMRRQVENSGRYRDESKRYDLKFVDFSDIERGNKALRESIGEWLSSIV